MWDNQKLVLNWLSKTNYLTRWLLRLQIAIIRIISFKTQIRTFPKTYEHHQVLEYGIPVKSPLFFRTVLNAEKKSRMIKLESLVLLFSVVTTCCNIRLWILTAIFWVSLHCWYEENTVIRGRHPKGCRPFTNTLRTPKLWIRFKFICIWFTTRDMNAGRSCKNNGFQNKYKTLHRVSTVTLKKWH